MKARDADPHSWRAEASPLPLPQAIAVLFIAIVSYDFHHPKSLSRWEFDDLTILYLHHPTHQVGIAENRLGFQRLTVDRTGDVKR